jgi:hypothetical protein
MERNPRSRTLRVDTSLQEKRGHAIQDSAHAVVLPYCVGAVCHNFHLYQGGAPTRLNAMLNRRVSEKSEVTVGLEMQKDARRILTVSSRI